MTNEQINTRIAEVCGFTNIRYDYPNGHVTTKEWLGESANGWTHILPDYLHSESEMASVVNLKRVDPIMYAIMLRNVVTACHNRDDQSFDAAEVYCIATATPRQQAEAFLRTIGAWVD